uniref:Protein kinase domain-containing protein n=1 Tax=Hordeum vulgare TaxID=4513 RepID=Q84NG6_HORVU|nr:putative protein kinase [Hordeum vulgare]
MIGTRVLAHSRVDPAIRWGVAARGRVVFAAIRWGAAARGRVVFAAVRWGAAARGTKREAGQETSTSETKKTKRKWGRGFCGMASHEVEEPLTSETKKTKRKWGRGFCGMASHEAEEPLTSETKKKRKNVAASSEPDKKRWFKNKIWKKKKAKNEQLATLVKEISLATKLNSAMHVNINLSMNICPTQTYEEHSGTYLRNLAVIAVKQLDKDGLQGNREFLVEVLMLSLLHHPNLVTLLGYCTECDQKILVYEYMPLGSLQDHLLDLTPKSQPLSWHTRMKIAVDAARGLEYLHEVANPPVVYRDLKASNILLDGNFSAKLADFGLAKLGPVGDKTHVTTRVMGTYGYCAPEYAMSGKLTKMSDIYCFGVVLLELITGRRAIDTTKPTREQILVHWAAPLFKDKKKFTKMADPLLDSKYPLKGLYQALAISSMCLQEEAISRPLISDVVTALTFLADPNYDPPDDIEPLPISVPNYDKGISLREAEISLSGFEEKQVEDS